MPEITYDSSPNIVVSKSGQKWTRRQTELADLAKIDAGDVSPHEDAERRKFANQALTLITKKYQSYIPEETLNRVKELEKRIVSYEDTTYYSILDLINFFEAGDAGEPDEESRIEAEKNEAERSYIGGASNNRDRHIYLEFPEKPEDLEQWWDDLEEDEQQRFLSKTGNNPDKAKELYFESTKKGIITHEIFHQFENHDLPSEILECAGRYYMNEVLSDLGLPRAYFSEKDQSRIDFYSRLMEEFGEDTVMSIYFGKLEGIDKAIVTSFVSRVTDQVRDDLFPNGEDL